MQNKCTCNANDSIYIPYGLVITLGVHLESCLRIMQTTFKMFISLLVKKLFKKSVITRPSNA